MEIRVRKFNDTPENYCFIAPNGDVYTYVEKQGDVFIGNISSGELPTYLENMKN